jgi:carbon starvation protein
MLFPVVLIAMAVLGLGYIFYGKRLVRIVRLDDSKPTPACTVNDGVDFVPAKASLLLGQHFSAIAAAGPIVGPILAGIWFGWGPALLWIVLGAIFIGGAHDFFALIASVRNKGVSIGELAKSLMSKNTQMLFLIFVWFALVYVIIAFTDITAQSFRVVSSEGAYGPAVLFCSFIYLILGAGMGLVLKYAKLPLWAVTAFFIPLLFGMILLGTHLPQSVTAFLLKTPVKGWEAGLLAYCFIASIIPVWVLLQPRGYLGGWFLYLTMAVALGGALFGGYVIQYPAFHVDGLKSLANGRPLFPILFITIACGACSGFHGIVSTGTTSKQICRESDTRTVGYGAMILESLVAVLALGTLMMLAPGDAAVKSDPNLIYANGLARTMAKMGISSGFALTFALLAFSTFVYDTLDVATRLARYIFQELTGWKSRKGMLAATMISLVLPFLFLMLAREKAYLAAWPIFGTSNQLLACLTLLVLAVWLSRTGRNFLYAVLPMIFMAVFSLWSLVLQIIPFVRSLPGVLSGKPLTPDVWISGICGLVLLILALWLMAEAIHVLKFKKQPAGSSKRGF